MPHPSERLKLKRLTTPSAGEDSEQAGSRPPAGGMFVVPPRPTPVMEPAAKLSLPLRTRPSSTTSLTPAPSSRWHSPYAFRPLVFVTRVSWRLSQPGVCAPAPDPELHGTPLHGRASQPFPVPRPAAPATAPHLVVLLQQHRVGEALVQAQLRQLPAGAPHVHHQVGAGDVAQDVQQDLVREAQQVGAGRHLGRGGGCVAIAGRVLKTRGTEFPWGPRGQPAARTPPARGVRSPETSAAEREPGTLVQLAAACTPDLSSCSLQRRSDFSCEGLGPSPVCFRLCSGGRPRFSAGDACCPPAPPPV